MTTTQDHFDVLFQLVELCNDVQKSKGYETLAPAPNTHTAINKEVHRRKRTIIEQAKILMYRLHPDSHTEGASNEQTRRALFAIQMS